MSDEERPDSGQRAIPDVSPEAAETWLKAFLGRCNGVAGTIHRLDDHVLVLLAAVNIPDKVQRVTRIIPKGKGMAGLAWERGVAVHSCNIQADAGRDVQPGAKAVAARGAIAIPVHDGAGDFAAVVGVAFADEVEFDDAAVSRLTADAAGIVGV